jgi:hypothetical protein
MNTVPTREQVRAAVEVARAVGDCIRELRTVPSGHLYARLMGNLSLEDYQSVIATLVRAGLVREHASHLLEWIGPSGPSANQTNTRKENTTMSIDIPNNAKPQTIRAKCQPPRGATHFRFTVKGRKPVIDSIKNIDTLAGCEGNIEFGKANFEGRGKHAKIKNFTPIETNKPAETKQKPEAKPAATPKAKKTKPTPGTKGRKPTILGHSACAVAKALGRAGLKHEEADRIFRAHGVEMPKASLSVQLGFGRNPELWEKRGQPAPLTEDQIAELRKAAA